LASSQLFEVTRILPPSSRRKFTVTSSAFSKYLARFHGLLQQYLARFHGLPWSESKNGLLRLAADWIIASVITDRRELDARRQAVASSTRSPNRALTASETATWSPWRAA
jgi:hypothetical protein